MDAPILQIGGKPYTMPPVSFASVQRAIPTIDAIAAAGAAAAPGTEQQIFRLIITAFCYFTMKPANGEPFDDAVAAAAAARQEEMSYKEAVALTNSWGQILTWIGLVPETGEAQAAG